MRKMNNLPCYPEQTSPDVYAAKQLIEPGQTAHATWHQWAMAYLVEGSCRWQIGDQLYEPVGGDLILIKPFIPNGWTTDDAKYSVPTVVDGALTTASGMELVWAIFNPRFHWLPWLDEIDLQHGGQVIPTRTKYGAHVADELLALSIELAQVYTKGDVMRDEWSLLILERLLLTVGTHSARLQIALDSRVRVAVEFIHERFSEPLEVSDIARAACLSPQRLSALFSPATGTPPAHYLERVRLNHAAQMIRLGVENIEEIAKSSGYTDVSHFYRRFKNQFKETPRSYRTAHLSKIYAGQ